LITGEGGAGKTWLWTQAVESLPPGWRSISVDLTSSLSAAEFLLLVGHGLGLDIPARLGAARLQIAAMLRDEAADGRSWVLVVDDADSASPQVWEEVRVLSNRLGRADGFASLVIVAQTGLVRRLAGREFASIAGRITDHVHLPPLDLDECRALIQDSNTFHHARAQASAIEEIQRDARGNCGEILRLARRRAGQTGRRSAEPRELGYDVISPRQSVLEPVGSVSDPFASPPERDLGSRPYSLAAEPSAPIIPVSARSTPQPSMSLVPSRPPLRLEEGLIEVGWRGESSPRMDLTDDDVESVSSPPSRVGNESDHELPMRDDLARPTEVAIEEAHDDERIDAEPAEEWLDDPYAALQAWSEWARNREQFTEPLTSPVETGENDGPAEAHSKPAPIVVKSAAESMAEANAGATIRAETQHEFSPYSRLFSDLRKSTQS
jgi:general secretion pathway protein A